MSGGKQRMIWKVKLRMDKKSIFHDPIHFCYDPIHLIFILLKIKSILLDLDINLIYILYIHTLNLDFQNG